MFDCPSISPIRASATSALPPSFKPKGISLPLPPPWLAMLLTRPGLTFQVRLDGVLGVVTSRRTHARLIQVLWSRQAPPAGIGATSETRGVGPNFGCTSIRGPSPLFVLDSGCAD